MQFRDLKKQYEVLKQQIDSAVVGVMTNANFISGRQVTELEEEQNQVIEAVKEYMK